MKNQVAINLDMFVRDTYIYLFRYYITYFCSRKPRVPGLSPVTSYVQSWTICSNRLANDKLSAFEVGGSGSDDVRAEIITSKLWINFTILFSKLKNVYDNDSNSTVTHTTINRTAPSFTKLLQNLQRRICCGDCDNLGNTELETLTRRIVPGSRINNEGINLKLKRVIKATLLNRNATI